MVITQAKTNYLDLGNLKINKEQIDYIYSITMTEYQSPSAYLILKHKIPIVEGNKIIEGWLAKHPQESRQTLAEKLQSRMVIFKDKQLQNLPQLSIDEAQQLAQKLQQQTSLVKDRWYQLKKYPQCFIGSELVEWLKQNLSLVTEEAIAIGQSLYEHKLIQHVTNDHEFKNDFLFYCFQN